MWVQVLKTAVFSGRTVSKLLHCLKVHNNVQHVLTAAVQHVAVVCGLLYTADRCLKATVHGLFSIKICDMNTVCTYIHQHCAFMCTWALKVYAVTIGIITHRDGLKNAMEEILHQQYGSSRGEQSLDSFILVSLMVCHTYSLHAKHCEELHSFSILDKLTIACFPEMQATCSLAAKQQRNQVDVLSDFAQSALQWSESSVLSAFGCHHGAHGTLAFWMSISVQIVILHWSEGSRLNAKLS